MKYVISLVAGILIGAALFGLMMFFNPFAGGQSISPLAVTDSRLLNLSFSSVSSETLLLTNDGESTPSPHPAKVLQLWEPPIGKTSAMVVVLQDGRGESAGIGIKFWSQSESTRVLSSKLLVDSIWHIYLPGRGTMLVDQQENYWSYLHDIVVEAHKSSGDSWRGNWNGVMTVGPNLIGTARVTGGTGEFAGIEMEAVESRSASAYTVAAGPVAMRGSLTISLPDLASSELEEAE